MTTVGEQTELWEPPSPRPPLLGEAPSSREVKAHLDWERDHSPQPQVDETGRPSRRREALFRAWAWAMELEGALGTIQNRARLLRKDLIAFEHADRATLSKCGFPDSRATPSVEDLVSRYCEKQRALGALLDALELTERGSWD